MKKSRYTETQIIKILKEVEAGRLVKEVCREYGIADATYYNWKSKYGGMEASDIKRLKETIQPGSDITISFAADPGSPYDGYWFYGIHLAELCVELMGEGFTSVAATRNGSRVKAEVNYATGKAQLVTSPDKEELTITVCRDGIETRHDIRMQYESIGPDELAAMLASGKPPRAYSSYAAAVRLLADIIRAAGL